MSVYRYDAPLWGGRDDPSQRRIQAAGDHLIAAGFMRKGQKLWPNLALVQEILRAGGHDDPVRNAPVILARLEAKLERGAYSQRSDSSSGATGSGPDIPRHGFAAPVPRDIREILWPCGRGSSGLGPPQVEVILIYVDSLAMQLAVEQVAEDLMGAKDGLVNQAIGYIIAHRFDEAIAVLGKALESGAYGATPYWYRGRAFFLKGEPQRAFEDFDHYLASDDTFRRATVWAGRAESLLALGRTAEAVASLEKGLQALLAEYGGPRQGAARAVNEPADCLPTSDLWALVCATRSVDANKGLPAAEMERMARIKVDIVQFRDSIDV